MDRLGTWEIPYTSMCVQTGISGRRSNNDPGPEGSSILPGAHLRDTKRGGSHGPRKRTK